MGYIYTLNDPNTNEIRYVGKTIANLDLRLARHIAQSKIGKSYVKSWIMSLLKSNLKPTINLIEGCDNSDLNRQEIYWISYYFDKVKLCNITKGGEGGSRNRAYALVIQDKINKVVSLVNAGIKLKDAETTVGLPNGYLSRARLGEIQFIVENNILVPKLPKIPNNKKKVIDDRTGTIYDSQKQASELLKISEGTVYNMIKQKRHLRLSK